MVERTYDLNLTLTEAEGLVLRNAIEGAYASLLPRINDPEVNAEFQVTKSILTKLEDEEKIVEGAHTVDAILNGEY